ncbi:M6 family metalloprotease domain-containing protein [bacterium]|nr:M6 family metalloprotease domain-containing protein [bacterium]
MSDVGTLMKSTICRTVSLTDDDSSNIQMAHFVARELRLTGQEIAMKPGTRLSCLEPMSWLLLAGLFLSVVSDRSVSADSLSTVPADERAAAKKATAAALSKEIVRQRRRHDPRLAARAPDEQVINPVGVHKELFIMLRFRNHRDRQLSDKSVYEAILNQPGGHPKYAPAGSLRDYGLEVSNGRLTLTSHIVGWVDLPETEQYYANGVEGTGPGNRVADAVRYALDYVDRNGLVDFRDLDRNGDRYADAVAFVHSGYGAEWPGVAADGMIASDRIWSHQAKIPVWTSVSGIRVTRYAFASGLHGVQGTEPCRLGLLAHETAHLGDLPDLYGRVGGWGIGAWGLMGFSDGFTMTGHRPSHLSAWAKVFLGWVTPVDLKRPGIYSIPQSETAPLFYRISDGFPEGEYLLIENRQPVGFDSDLPDGKGGLAIWHVDENMKSNDVPKLASGNTESDSSAHYMVSLVQADGRFDLEHGNNFGDAEDLFRGGRVDSLTTGSGPAAGIPASGLQRVSGHVLHRISQISEPAEVMTFRYDRVIQQPQTELLAANQSVAGTPARVNTDNSVQSHRVSIANTDEFAIPIAGARVASASFSSEEQRQLTGYGVLLEATINLASESVVHVRANTSLTPVGAGGPVTMGINSDRSSPLSMWRESIRIVSPRSAGHYVNVSLNSCRRLPPGQHAIRWVVRSNHVMHFGSGGALLIQTFPCQPRRASDTNRPAVPIQLAD